MAGYPGPARHVIACSRESEGLEDGINAFYISALVQAYALDLCKCIIMNQGTAHAHSRKLQFSQRAATQLSKQHSRSEQNKMHCAFGGSAQAAFPKPVDSHVNVGRQVESKEK